MASKSMTRREARETLLGLLFETEYRADEGIGQIYETSVEVRDIPEDAYVKTAYFGIWEHREAIDALIERHATGWKTERMTRVSRAVLRLAVYELMYCADIPSRVTINEAIELTKCYDEEKAKAFVNGILNAVKNEIGDKA